MNFGILIYILYLIVFLTNYNEPHVGMFLFGILAPLFAILFAIAVGKYVRNEELRRLKNKIVLKNSDHLGGIILFDHNCKVKITVSKDIEPSVVHVFCSPQDYAKIVDIVEDKKP